MNKRGVSILELVVSLLLLFIASSFLMGMFLSAGGAPKRLERGTQLEQLASFKMDEIMVAELGTPLGESSGTFPDYPDFQYSVSTEVSSFDPDMLAVVVEARSPDGQKRRLVALKPSRKPNPPPPPPVETAFDFPSFIPVGIGVIEPAEPVEPPPVLPPPQVVIDNACLSCHGGDYPSAPIWNLDNITSSAQAAGQSPTAYIITSIEDPSAYVVPGYGYPADPNTPGSPEYSPMEGAANVTPEEAQQIANWILSGGTNYDAPTPPGPEPATEMGSPSPGNS